jgi:hypothetical protein
MLCKRKRCYCPYLNFECERDLSQITKLHV